MRLGGNEGGWRHIAVDIYCYGHWPRRIIIRLANLDVFIWAQSHCDELAIGRSATADLE